VTLRLKQVEHSVSAGRNGLVAPTSRSRRWETLARFDHGTIVKGNVSAEMEAHDDATVRRMLHYREASGVVRWSRAIDAVPMAAHVSGDRLLVTTNSLEYHAWGHLGPALLLDLNSGQLLKELFGARGAALSEGHFVLGVEGYDHFDTWLYGPSGDVIQQWRSFGHYVVDDGSSIRVIECDRRRPTRSRVARLSADGKVFRGDRLAHGQVSPPLLIDEGRALLVNGGVLTLLSDDLALLPLVDLLEIPEEANWLFSSEFAGKDDHFTVAIFERGESSLEYQTHSWTFAIEGGRVRAEASQT
jgi:hypothetical protein